MIDPHKEVIVRAKDGTKGEVIQRIERKGQKPEVLIEYFVEDTHHEGTQWETVVKHSAQAWFPEDSVEIV